MTAYLSAFKEFECSADVRDPVDSFQLVALLARLQMEEGKSRENDRLARTTRKLQRQFTF